MAIVLCQELNGQAVGDTYNGPAGMVPWLLAEGYAKDTSNPTSHISTGAAPPSADPTLAVNREDPNDTNGLTSDRRDFQFGSDPAVLAAQLYSIEPASGPAAGGTALVLLGDNFTGITGVTLGGVAVTSLVVVTDKKITCTTGAHAAGVVDVVLDKTGTSADKTVDDGFTYTA